ncbi:PepSY-associated TM helix domain protein [Burkholderia ambifaria MEX-5]|uniref:PepSY-associated TM helix domain protein n=1 Tax=Burkholderia ambifaria MEX-5 TaxID=396597 RepID=B1SWV9_9BURK|nr:PepSY-associated TM helix domain protein [Burkholderia ambifaria MEX-5]
MLSLTGVLLRTELNKRKTIGALRVIGSIVAIVCAAGA